MRLGARCGAVGAALILGVVALPAPTTIAVAGSLSNTFAFETVYSGSATFTGYQHEAQAPSVGQTLESDTGMQTITYNWQMDRVDTFTSTGPGTFSEKLAVVDVSTGSAHAFNEVTNVNPNGTAIGKPEVLQDSRCTDISTGHTYEASRPGIVGVPSRGSSSGGDKVLVTWEVPYRADSTGQFYFDGPPFSPGKAPVLGDAPGVTQNCTGAYGAKYSAPDGSSLVLTSNDDGGAYQASGGPYGYDLGSAGGWQARLFGSCGGNYLVPDMNFYEIWSGGAALYPGQLPYSKDLNFTNVVRGDESKPTFYFGTTPPVASGQCAYSVKYNATVKFVQLRCAHGGSVTPPTITAPSPTVTPSGGVTYTVETESPPVCNKVGALLLEDGVRIMNGEAVDLSNGENVQVLFPGMPEGAAQATPETAVDMTISGQVLPSQGPGAQLADLGPVVLYHGSAEVGAGDPTPIWLYPTAVGKRLLGHSHGPIAVTGTIAATAPGSPPLSAKGSFTVPAFSS